MIINTCYRMGSHIDLCRCPCNNGCWQTSCPCNQPPCCPSNDFCCQPCCNCPSNNFNQNNNSCDGICIPKNALFFMAGYYLSKNLNKNC